ncbi:MAG: hypothetical protein LBL94_01460 [Prevotellaceae bacterium]|jgi:hypothetical protein|nr:hypothetical protein [Prevotellaceae bacterium]
MKKILLLSLVAFTAACCGPKKDVTDVDSLITNPAQYLGKEITFVGKAVVTNQEAGRVAVYGSDSTKYIIAQAGDTVKVCPSICGKLIEVTGSIREVVPGVFIVDSVCHTAFVVENYYVDAKSIKPAQCCKKDGEKCCKKDGEKCAKGEKKCCKKEAEGESKSCADSAQQELPPPPPPIAQ